MPNFEPYITLQMSYNLASGLTYDIFFLFFFSINLKNVQITGHNRRIYKILKNTQQDSAPYFYVKISKSRVDHKHKHKKRINNIL